MKKVLIPVHSGFEETELITTINVLNREGIEYLLWSIEGIDMVHSQHEALVMTSPIFPTNEEFDAIFFHGGKAVEDMVDYDEVIHLAKTFNDQGKIVSAICAAPEILLKAGILEGIKYTAFPGSAESPTKISDEVVVDGLVITGRDYSVTQKFAERLAKEIKK